MKTVCKENMCAGCMACVDACSQNAINIVDNLKYYNAIIDESKCINCKLCYRVCQENNTPQMAKPLEWYQGWAKDSSIRKGSSSGGVCAEITKSFIKNGGKVAGCYFKNGEFVFSIAPDTIDSSKFQGSKYIKSNPISIYREVKESLLAGNKVLFIGLPCQVASLKNFCKNNDNLYTIDLICHGSPSPQIIEKFLEQYDCKLTDFEDIAFRNNNHFQIYKKSGNCYYGIDKDGITDSYLIAFLNCLCYTENCYECKYARIERVGDITLGDSWGSELEKKEQKKGISLILCQNQKGMKLINQSELMLLDVDLQKAVASNHQLKYPSKKNKNRNVFFELLSSGHSFNKIIKKLYFKMYIKQMIKRVLLSMRIIKI